MCCLGSLRSKPKDKIRHASDLLGKMGREPQAGGRALRLCWSSDPWEEEREGSSDKANRSPWAKATSQKSPASSWNGCALLSLQRSASKGSLPKDSEPGSWGFWSAALPASDLLACSNCKISPDPPFTKVCKGFSHVMTYFAFIAVVTWTFLGLNTFLKLFSHSFTRPAFI